MSVLVEHIKASSVANYEECMAQQGTIAMIGCPSVINRVGGPLHCLFGDESPDGLSEKKARLHRAVLDPAVTPRVEGGDVPNKSLCEGISCWVQCKLKGGKLLRIGRQFNCREIPPCHCSRGDRRQTVPNPSYPAQRPAKKTKR